MLKFALCVGVKMPRATAWALVFDAPVSADQWFIKGQELPHIDYLSCYKKNTLCSALELNIGPGRRLCVTESLNIHNSLGYCAASAVLYCNHTASRAWMTNVIVCVSNI